MIKKIGILTHPLTENYGGILQAAVLYGYLEDKGYEVILLRKHKYRPLWKNALIFLLERCPGQNFRRYRYLYKKRKVQETFINEYIKNKTPIIYKTEELVKASKDHELDAVIVGSDQVWKLSSVDDGYYDSYFLSFVSSKSVKKIAYAASFGVDHWQDMSRVTEVKKYLADFHAISVRESSGVDICKDTFDIAHCEHVLDPTLLVDMDFYKKFDLKKANDKPFIATYFLDPDLYKVKLVEEALDAKGSSYEVAHLADPNDNSIRRVDQWLWEIQNADLVITDSFHGMVLSIAFKRNFIAIGNKRRGMARFESLLGLLGLNDRLIRGGRAEDIEDIKSVISCDIDYSKLDGRLSLLREKSAQFLSLSLRGRHEQ